MQILHVVQSLDPAWGGIARVVPMLARGLVEAGDSCRVATLAGGRYGTPPEIAGVEVCTFSAPDGSRLGRSREFARRAAELVAEADVVHFHGLWTHQNWSAGQAARAAGRPYVMSPRSMMMPWAWRRSRWKKLLAGWAFEHANLRGAACLHALAEQEAEHVRRLGFNDRVVVVPNGIHAAAYESLPGAEALETRFPAWRGQRLLVMLGRISPQKGIIQGLKACFDCFSVAAGWHMVVAGPDEFGMQRMLHAAVGRKGVADRVTFTGMLGRDEVRALLGRASLLLQPSMSEGLSNSILEAMAAGLPVLISDACNLPEVEAAGAGRVTPADRRAITAALRSLVAMDAEALREMGRRGRELVKSRFDWSVVLPGYRAMYERALPGA